MAHMAMGLGEVRHDMSDLPEVPLEHGAAPNAVEEHSRGPRSIRRRARQRARRKCCRNGHRQKRLALWARVEQLETNMMPYRSTVQEKPHANMHVLCTNWEDLELRVHEQLGRIMQAVECGHERLQDIITTAQQCQELRISSLFTLTQQIMAQVEMDAVHKCAQMADPDAVKIEERLGIATELTSSGERSCEA